MADLPLSLRRQYPLDRRAVLHRPFQLGAIVPIVPNVPNVTRLYLLVALLHQLGMRRSLVIDEAGHIIKLY